MVDKILEDNPENEELQDRIMEFCKGKDAEKFRDELEAIDITEETSIDNWGSSVRHILNKYKEQARIEASAECSPYEKDMYFAMWIEFKDCSCLRLEVGFWGFYTMLGVVGADKEKGVH